MHPSTEARRRAALRIEDRWNGPPTAHTPRRVPRTLFTVVSGCLGAFTGILLAPGILSKLTIVIWAALFVIYMFQSRQGRILNIEHPTLINVLFVLFTAALTLFLQRLADPRLDMVPVFRIPSLPQDVRLSFGYNASNAALGHGNANAQDFSIIIAARDEDDYIAKTVRYTIENTPGDVIREIIIVDDASKRPQAEVLNEQLTSKEKRVVKVIRFDEPQGLIRARIVGADSALSGNLFFLDGHCRPKPGWHKPLLKHLTINYKRLICPVIQDIRPITWEDVGTQGTKMMFTWDFEFDWYDDESTEVPISAGGILAMTKKWWEESGKYDPGMKEWGGENLEQSMRVWMCGGEIHVARDSFVGHIFERPAKPNPGNTLVRQVQRNQKRAALVWLDDYYHYFETHHPVVKMLDEGPGLELRMQLRQRLGCHNFEWYVQRFRTAFERRGMLLHHFHHLKHRRSGWCLSSDGNKNRTSETYQVALKPCEESSKEQRWQPVAGGRMLFNQLTNTCLDRGGNNAGGNLILYPCDWAGVFSTVNQNQLWIVDGNLSGHVFTHMNKDFQTVTGNDFYSVAAEKAIDRSSLCIASALKVDQDALGELMRKGSYSSADVVLEACEADEALQQQWQWLW